MRSTTKKAIIGAGTAMVVIVGSVVGFNSAYADENSDNTAEVLKVCAANAKSGAIGAGNVDGPGNGECHFTPAGDPTYTVESPHSVGTQNWNCSNNEQKVTYSTTEHTGQSDSITVSVEAGFSLFKIVDATVSVSYGHVWESSHDETISKEQTLAPGEVGWIKYGPSLTHVTGTMEANFEDRVRHHYHWEIAPYEQVAPTVAGDGRPIGNIVFNAREMTPEEKSANCGTGVSKFVERGRPGPVREQQSPARSPG